MSISAPILTKTPSLKPGYKQTKLGLIPADWSFELLDSLARRGSGHTPNKKFDSYYNGGIKWVSLIDSKRLDNGLIDKTKIEISVEGLNNSSAVLHPKGTVLISRDAGIGKSAVMGTEMAVSQHFIVWQTNSSLLNNWFLYYWLQFKKREFERIAIGSTIKTIGLPYFKKYKLPVPPLPEQQKIATILSTWDTAITKMEALITQKQQLKKGLMQQLLTGKTRFVEFIKSTKTKTTKLGEIPEDWELLSFNDIPDKKVKWSLTGGPFGSDLKSEDYTPEGIRILQLQNLGDGSFIDNYRIYTSEKKADRLLACNIYPGEIIMSKMGDPVARACIIPQTAKRFLMASDGIRLVPNAEVFETSFALFFINYSLFRRLAIRHSTGSTRQRIGLGDLKKLPFIRPRLKEQQKIAAVISAADVEIKGMQRQLAQLKVQKKGLMQKLLTGVVRVKIEQEN